MAPAGSKRAIWHCARDKGVLIEPGDVFFRPEEPSLNYFRLSYSAISTDRIAEGVARLAAVIDEMKAEHSVSQSQR